MVSGVTLYVLFWFMALPHGENQTLMNNDKVDTNQKALQINLDGQEIWNLRRDRGGQEVARCSSTSEEAAGTVAKTISAYDMGVSDAIYGTSGPYVSRSDWSRCWIMSSTCSWSA